ncbi:hypothetical protein ACU8KH_01642 [Lachancea thermotolerans]
MSLDVDKWDFFTYMITYEQWHSTLLIVLIFGLKKEFRVVPLFLVATAYANKQTLPNGLHGAFLFGVKIGERDGFTGYATIDIEVDIKVYVSLLFDQLNEINLKETPENSKSVIPEFFPG